jgi:hypothetical protein
MFLTYPVGKGASFSPDTTCHCACQGTTDVCRISWTVQITHEQVKNIMKHATMSFRMPSMKRQKLPANCFIIYCSGGKIREIAGAEIFYLHSC